MANKKNFVKFFKVGWNKIFGKEEDSTSLRTKSLFRAMKGIQNVGTKKISKNKNFIHDLIWF